MPRTPASRPTGLPGYERGARRAPREPGGEFSPRAVIGQGAIAPGTEVEPHPAALPLDLARYALRIVLEVGS
jgi:hypothetical protein